MSDEREEKFEERLVARDRLSRGAIAPLNAHSPYRWQAVDVSDFAKKYRANAKFLSEKGGSVEHAIDNTKSTKNEGPHANQLMQTSQPTLDARARRAESRKEERKKKKKKKRERGEKRREENEKNKGVLMALDRCARASDGTERGK